MKATQVIGNDNIIYSYLPISYETLQSAIFNQQLPITITSNVIMKLPEKNLTCTVQNQDEDILANHIDNDNFIEHSHLSRSSENENLSGTTTACIINQESISNKDDIFKKGKQNLKCDTCDKEFYKVSNYKKHLLIHRNVKKFKCEHCFESFNIEDNYKLHMALHAHNQPMCPLCKRQFQRMASLKAHLLMHQVEETFVCKECLAEFEKEDDYNRHMESHSSVNTYENIPYICSYCNYLFEDPKDYKEHVSYHIKIKKLVYNPKRTRKRAPNNKEYNHRCSVCSKSFPKNCLLLRHMRIHNGEKPFACTKCDKAFSQKSTLQIHLVKHSGHKPFKCTLCPAEYFQKGNLRVHVQKTHTAPPNIDKMYKCTQCTCIFRKIASLNAHITKAHGIMKNIDELTDMNEKVKAIKKICDQLAKGNEKIGENASKSTEDLLGSVEPNETFVKLAENSVDGTLRRYVVKQKRVGDTKWFICLYCSKEFKKPSDLIRHIRIHTREKPYKCKTCNQGFALKSTLLSHLNTHDGKREFQCLICLKFFTSARTLSVHTRKHNKSGSTTSLKYKCSTCTKLFSTIAKVREHMDIHNCGNADNIEKNVIEEEYEAQAPLKQPMLETEKGLVTVPAPKPRIPYGELEEYKNRPYRCHICNAAFLKPTHVRRHMLTHSGEKNFKCDLCSKAFLTSYGLKDHLRFHTSEKKFACSVCSQKFLTKEFLKRHQVKHSPLRPYICPYCKRRSKTAALCRKHITTHRSDSHLINSHTEMESNPTKTIDLVDISNNPFDLVTVDEESIFFNSNNNDLQFVENPVSTLPTAPVKNKSKNKSRSRKAKHKSDSKKPAANASDYDYDVLNLPSNAQIFISREGHYSIIMSDTCEMETASVNSNIGEIDQEPGTIISYDEYQSANNDVYNNLLSNVKLQNNDPILVSTIGESQDSNILFMDPTLTQNSEFQNDAQNFEPFNPTIFHSNVELNLGSQTSIANGEIIQNDQAVLASSKKDAKSSQLILNFSEDGNMQSGSNKKSNSIIDSSKLLLASDNINLNDNLIITLNGDDFSNMNFNLNMHPGLNPAVDNLALNIMDNEVQGTFACTICKISFSNIQDLEKHQCIEPIATELHEVDDDESLNQMDANKDIRDIKHEGEITLITDYNDQLDTTHVEISTDELSRDSVIEKNQGKDDNKSDKRTNISRLLVPKNFENVCNYCSKSFKKASDLIRHIRTHTGERPFDCNKCNKSFSLKSTLQSHLRTHSDTRNKYVCQVCNSNYSCRATLKIHMRIHTGAKPYSCQICPAKFRTSTARNSHILAHAKNSKKTQVQNNNKPLGNFLETLITDEATGVHIEEGNSTANTESVQSNETQQMGTLPIELLQQLQTAGILIQENRSDVLGASSLVQLSYESTISNDKVARASKTIQSASVTIEPTVSGIAGNQRVQKLKKIECNFCHKTYTTKSALRKHQKRHKKDFHCPKCDKQFDSQDLLDKHVKLHSGYRPFSCTHCANSFSEEGSLKTHIKRIHNIH